jgi:hypothetical protein
MERDRDRIRYLGNCSRGFGRISYLRSLRCECSNSSGNMEQELEMSNFLSGYVAGFASFAFILALWKWIKWELSGNWL